MAFSGNLEDLPFVDIIQLLHVARKSGTLHLSCPQGEADIICKDGDIVGVIHPHKDVNLGGILVEMGAVTSKQLEEALSRMEEAGKDSKPLMSTLIDLGHLQKKQGWEGLETLIHRTMAEIISWNEGTFNFDLEKLVIDDDFRHFPVEMEAAGGVDAQGALVEALRIFDERNREHLEQEKREQENRERKQRAKQKIDSLDEEETKVLSSIEEVPEDMEPGLPIRPRKAVLLCSDGFVKNSIRKICRDNKIFASISDVERDVTGEIEDSVAERSATVLVVDLSNDGDPGFGPKKRVSMVRRIKHRNPEIPLVILSNSFGVKAYTQMFEMGARTMIPKPGRKNNDTKRYVQLMKRFFSVLTACLISIFDEEHFLLQRTRESRMQMASLKRRVHEIQDRRTSPDISLIVLQYIAEYMGRGIIFLVRKTDILGLGSFGMDNKGDTISLAAMRLRIPLTKPSIFADVIKKGIVFQGESDDALLQKYLFDRIGVPSSNEVLLLPLKTENKTRALVYCDFGKHEAGPVKTDALEILASQAGMAMEVAIQRSRIDPEKGSLKKKK
ncbi:MAG: DUF4388 domain-containing protein [Proteobacteria bacterium]|nr:DUF4388 domain-containing protein [Pseudomonadota bacterium]